MLCFECENASNANLLTVSNQHICSDCQVKYYLDCASCQKFVPKEECLTRDDTVFCRDCLEPVKSDKLVLFAVENLDELIAEFLELHAQEKLVKDRLDKIKETLKTIALNEERQNNAVYLKSPSGTVKCAFKKTTKCDSRAVFAVKETLEPQVFEMLFKTEFKPNKDFQENLSVVKDTFDDELAALVNSAVIVTESPTLTIEK